MIGVQAEETRHIVCDFWVRDLDNLWNTWPVESMGADNVSCGWGLSTGYVEHRERSHVGMYQIMLDQGGTHHVLPRCMCAWHSPGLLSPKWVLRRARTCALRMTCYDSSHLHSSCTRGAKHWVLNTSSLALDIEVCLALSPVWVLTVNCV